MFQFKVTRRTLACKYQLEKWKIKDNNICDTCNNEIDIIEHHLVACPETLAFWTNLFNWFKSVTETSIPVDTYDIIFGLPNPNEEPLIIQLNYVMLLAKYYIYVAKKKGKTLDLYLFLIECKRSLQQKNMIMTIVNDKQNKKFSRTWEPLLECM
jgi:hypothetical protein